MKLRLVRLTIIVGLKLTGLNLRLGKRKTMVELGLAMDKLILVLGRDMVMVKLWLTGLSRILT